MALDYVLITPARNEADYIEKTLQSVVAQTHLPKRWVIVSDGSTDATDDLVQKYQEGREWLELLRLPERQERHFAAKVRAFEAGYERVKDLDFEVIGNLDGDVSFDPKTISNTWSDSSPSTRRLALPVPTTSKAIFIHLRTAISTSITSTVSASCSGGPATKTSAAMFRFPAAASTGSRLRRPA